MNMRVGVKDPNLNVPIKGMTDEELKKQAWEQQRIIRDLNKDKYAKVNIMLENKDLGYKFSSDREDNKNAISFSQSSSEIEYTKTKGLTIIEKQNRPSFRTNLAIMTGSA